MQATTIDHLAPQSRGPFEEASFEPHRMTHASGSRSSAAVSDVALYRLASVAGLGSAFILLVNAAKRSSLIATTDLTQLLAPLAEILALGLIVGLFLAAGRRAGLFGTISFLINFIALASLEGVEVVINLVFSKLPSATIMDLLAGPLGLVLTISSMLFLIGTITFAISLAIGKGVPRLALALYALGAVPIAFRAFVPELVLDLGLVILAAAIAWLAGWLWIWAGKMGESSTRA